MAEQEQNTKKVPAGTNLEPGIFAAVERLRREEDRPMSNMIERLLKTHPRVQEILETETAGASA